MKHIFLINPISGHGTGKKQISFIEDYCQKENLDYQILISEYSGHTTVLAKGFTAKDDVCLYGVGGDGTAYEVLNGLNEGVLMAIIPAGSGNDFYSNISSNKKDLKDIIIETINGENVEVDYAVANGSRFLNCATVGFDATINYMMNIKYRNIKIIPSKMMYVYAALANVFKPEPLDITYSIDGIEYTNTVLLLGVINGTRYGGGFKPAPSALVNDRKLDFCMIDFVKTGTILRLLPVYYRGKHVNLPVATMRQGKEFRITGDKPMYFNVDGEIIETQDMKISLQADKINMRVSKSAKEKLALGKRKSQ